MSGSTRRAILAALGAAVPAGLAPRGLPLFGTTPARRRELLILGGTGFLGPAVVEAALARGHGMTLFNRGRTDPGLFPDLPKLRGDRDTGNLRALEGRKFDAVIDTSGYVPDHVGQAAGMLADDVRQYVFLSSVSVYPAFASSTGDIDEESDVAPLDPGEALGVDTIADVFAGGGRLYGPMKAECERRAEEAMPGRVTCIRPGLIAGPRDRSDRFTWWPVRVDRGGEILAPGGPDGRIQAIDVRDLGRWIIHCIEENVTGVYNACGFRDEVSMEMLLHGCRCATSTPGSLTWVDGDFLLEHAVQPWSEMPLWLPEDRRSYVRNDRAIAAGLRFRPLADTIADTLRWAREGRGDRPWQAGLDAEREAGLLARWNEERGK